MRVMVMVKANDESEAGTPADTEMLEEMGKYNEELVKAGVMLAGEGLQPSSKGARVQFSGDERTVIDGPFAETKELIAGFWIWQVARMDEAIEWVKRCPNPTGERERRRDPPGVRARGLRRRVDARAARARGAAARAQLEAAVVAARTRSTARARSRRSGGSSRPRLIAGLARIVRDVGLAEELAQDALVAALEQWPESGVPDNPGAWLMATAKHRAIDRAAARQRRSSASTSELGARARDAAATRRRPTSTPRSTTTSATTSCG